MYCCLMTEKRRLFDCSALEPRQDKTVNRNLTNIGSMKSSQKVAVQELSKQISQISLRT